MLKVAILALIEYVLFLSSTVLIFFFPFNLFVFNCLAGGTLFGHYTHIQLFAAQAIVRKKDTKAKQEFGYDLPRSVGYFTFKGLKFPLLIHWAFISFKNLFWLPILGMHNDLESV